MQRSSSEIDHPFAMLIDGQWVGAAAEQTFTCVDPYTEESWGRIPEASAAEVDRAVRAARRAFHEGGWQQTLPAQRAALLRKLARLIEANAEALTYQQIRENGKLVSEMRPQLDVLASACYYFAGLAETLTGASATTRLPITIKTVCDLPANRVKWAR